MVEVISSRSTKRILYSILPGQSLNLTDIKYIFVCQALFKLNIL